MNKKIILGIPVLVLIYGQTVAAQELLRAIDLPGLTREALEKSPGLKSKKAEYEALRSKAVRAWLPEDPMFGVDVEGQPDVFDFDARMNNEYMAQQTIPFPTKLFLSGVIASREADMAYQKFKEEARDVVWHVEEPYYELYAAQKTLEILKENRALLEQIAATAKARYESNQAPQMDFLKAQVELGKNSVELFEQEQTIHLKQAHFSHVLNEPLNTVYEIPQSLEEKRSFGYTHAELETLALDRRPELKAMEIGVERAKASRALARTEWLPDVTLRYEWREYEAPDRADEHDTFIGVTVPFWSLVKGISGVWRSADQDVVTAEQTFLKIKNEVFLSLHEAYSQVKNAQNALEIYEQQVIPQAKQQAQIGLSAYEAGRTDFLNVVDSQRTLLAVQTEYYKYWAAYRTGLSALRLAVGDDLPEAY